MGPVAIVAAQMKAALASDRKAYRMVAQVDRERILRASEKYLKLKPVTITTFRSHESPGGPHDYFSQADYFWPNPQRPDGPYIYRDGQSNPDNFTKHRNALLDLSIQMPTLTAAWLLTGDRLTARRAGDHLRAWFVTPETRMNPNLEFAQGIHGIWKGTNSGIIDTLQLVEVARAASLLNYEALSGTEMRQVKQWFREYLEWLKNSKNGNDERETHNNHATCWALQAAEFARLVDDEGTRAEVRRWFSTTLLSTQLARNGSFPLELKRTKPYSYSIFNFDVMAGLAQSLKGSGVDMTTFALPDGRGLCRTAEFIYPYLKDKSMWPYRQDVEHFDALPVRSPGLLFAGLACHRSAYIALWKTLNPDPTDREIIRNYPIRQPLLWV